MKHGRNVPIQTAGVFPTKFYYNCFQAQGQIIIGKHIFKNNACVLLSFKTLKVSSVALVYFSEGRCAGLLSVVPYTQAHFIKWTICRRAWKRELFSWILALDSFLKETEDQQDGSAGTGAYTQPGQLSLILRPY